MIRNRILFIFILLSFLFSNIAYSIPTTNDKRNQDDSYENSIQKENLMEHLEILQDIASKNGGNRLVGTKGHQDTMDYINKSIKSYGYEPQLQEIKLNRNDTIGRLFITTIDNKQHTLEVKHIYGSPFTSNEGISGPLVLIEKPCEPINVNNQHQRQPWIALIQRGECSKDQMIALAQQDGATAVIMYPSDSASRQELTTHEIKSTIPTGVLSVDSINPLLTAMKQTSTLTVQLQIVTKLTPVTSYNIIAETKAGNKSNVVMIGAHSDSVVDGPGINDDGSGVSALLELARHFDQTEIKNTVRFCWWTAEEEGLLGSTAYVAALSNERKHAISLYLNADMIASPNYVNMVYEGNESDPPAGFSAAPRGSKAIQLAFQHYFDENDKPHETLEYKIVAVESDAGPFYKASIPSGGLSTGFINLKTEQEFNDYGGHQGVAHDPCYHAACDTINNINPTGFVIQTRAFAYALEMYSRSTASLLDPLPN